MDFRIAALLQLDYKGLCEAAIKWLMENISKRCRTYRCKNEILPLPRQYVFFCVPTWSKYCDVIAFWNVWEHLNQIFLSTPTLYLPMMFVCLQQDNIWVYKARLHLSKHLPESQAPWAIVSSTWNLHAEKKMRPWPTCMMDLQNTSWGKAITIQKASYLE